MQQWLIVALSKWLWYALHSALANQSLLVDVQHITTGAPAQECIHRDLKTVVYGEIQRDLPGGHRLNQHCISPMQDGSAISRKFWLNICIMVGSGDALPIFIYCLWNTQQSTSDSWQRSTFSMNRINFTFADM